MKSCFLNLLYAYQQLSTGQTIVSWCQYLWRQQLCANNDHLPFRFFKFYYFLVSISQHDCHEIFGKRIVVCASTTSRSSCLQQSTSKQRQPRAKHKMPQTPQWPVPNPVLLFYLFSVSLWTQAPQWPRQHITASSTWRQTPPNTSCGS